MTERDLVQIVLTAVSYFFFSNEFFKFSAEIKEEKISYRSRCVCFFAVYIWFIIGSNLELPLVMNWFVFLIILGVAVYKVFSFDLIEAYALSMFCAIMSLAVNIFFRSFAAILLDVPLNVFDNYLSDLKAYPIALGFTAMVVLMYFLRRRQFTEQLKQLLQYRKSLWFYFWTEIFIYFFLMAQLVAYSQSGNEIGVKMWGIKSALFSGVVLIVTVIYSLRVVSLHYYMQKQHEIRDQLIQEKKDINKLWSLAYTDMLTGCNNRQLLDKRLEEYAGYGGSITLAFVDVNGLKLINDQYGHMEGDNYLLSVSRILTDVSKKIHADLFRYGGDEFVIMSNTLSEKEIMDYLAGVNESLEKESKEYERSVSYGVAHGDCTEYQELINMADEIMYEHKLRHYKKEIRA